MKILNAWYAICKSDKLKNRPLSKKICSIPIVVFRNESGIAALLDRCPHRGVPLSKGYVQEGCIVCPYHGWRYDGNGKCTFIPEIEERGQKIPKRATSPFFPIQEKGGYLWVFMGDKERASETPIPWDTVLTDPKWSVCCNAHENIACHWLHMVENILDGAHLPYVHEGSLDNGNRFIFNWSRKFRRKKKEEDPKEMEIVVTENGFEAFSEANSQSFRFCVHLPSTVTLKLDFGKRKIRVWVHVAPIDDKSCRVEHAFCRNFLLSPVFDPIFRKSARKFLLEDIQIVELLQPTYDQEGRKWEVSTIRDKIPLHLRALVKKAFDLERVLPNEKALLEERAENHPSEKDCCC